VIALHALLLGLVLVSSQGQVEVPKNDGWVTDLAQLLTPEQERSLESLMESYKAGTTHEIALLTVPELEGRPIEEYARTVGRAWKIGGKADNNGALIVVAKQEREVRIETGRGLEGPLPDALAWRIIQNEIVPRFKEGRFYEGLRAGIEAAHKAIGGHYATPVGPGSRGGSAIGSSLAVLAVVLLFFFIAARSARRTHRRGWRGGFFGPFGPFGPLGMGGMGGGGGHSGGFGGFSGGGGFSGFGGGGGFSGGGATGRW
jgi:uncharacterized protein